MLRHEALGPVGLSPRAPPGLLTLCLYIFFGDVLRDVGSACLEPHKTCLLILRLEVAQPRVRLQSISTHTPGLLTFGAIWVAAAAGISAPWNYTMIRTLPCIKQHANTIHSFASLLIDLLQGAFVPHIQLQLIPKQKQCDQHHLHDENSRSGNRFLHRLRWCHAA